MQRYDVEANGFKTTVQLSDAEAERLGLKKAVDSTADKAPANKNRKPSNKAVSVGATGGAE